jgi:hypothetical protein
MGDSSLFALKHAMARRHFIGKQVLFVGEAFSLDHRGWKAAPTENDPTYLKGDGGCGHCLSLS